MSSANPFEAPRSDLGQPGPSERKKLGSLAQTARGNEINKARIGLIVAGLILIAQNGFLYSNTESEIRDALDAEVQKQGPGFVVDQPKFNEVLQDGIRFGHVLYGGAGACGVVLVALGALLSLSPIAFSIIGLLIYLATIAVFGYLNPLTLLQFWLVKIVVIACLIKAIQAAIEYRKETRIVQAMGGSLS